MRGKRAGGREIMAMGKGGVAVEQWRKRGLGERERGGREREEEGTHYIMAIE